MVIRLLGAAHTGGIFHHSHVVIFPVARQIMGVFELNFVLALEIMGRASKAAPGGSFGTHSWSMFWTSQSAIFFRRSSSSSSPELTARAIWLMLDPILPSSARIFLSSSGLAVELISWSRANDRKKSLIDMPASEHRTLMRSASPGVT